jgi:predicted ABC-class ATPase
MLTPNCLKQKLVEIDGRDYENYQSLKGTYEFDGFELIVQQIPKDPYAPPQAGVYRVRAARSDPRILNPPTGTKVKRIACADFLARAFWEACRRVSTSRRGTGYSGIITLDRPGQAILERSSVVIGDAFIEVRCFIGLPAHGRKIDASLAAHMIFSELPQIVSQSLLDANTNHQTLQRHIAAAEDAEFLRGELDSLGLIAFIADQALLPRASGTSDRPLPDAAAMPFCVPENLATAITLPHAGKIKGMGIPSGITLIVGGGYHGKSTLLHALEAGIYNHIPGDGRERCVSNPQTVKIRAYSGRSIAKTDISYFIKNLPFKKDTGAFCTPNASGSTSQAASIIEALEAGARVLLMDEDTCAANFMIRDSKMQQLVDKREEPITPFIDRAKHLYLEKNISTVLVLGGVGDYFDVADHVIQMIDYQPCNVTETAHRIAANAPAKRITEDEYRPLKIRERSPVSASIDAFNDYGKRRIFAKEVHRLNFGKQVVDLTDVEQLVEASQTRAIGYAIEYAKKYMDANTPLRKIVQRVTKDIEDQDLDMISDRISGYLAGFRGHELAFTLNRFRGLEVVQRPAGRS